MHCQNRWLIQLIYVNNSIVLYLLEQNKWDIPINVLFFLLLSIENFFSNLDSCRCNTSLLDQHLILWHWHYPTVDLSLLKKNTFHIGTHKNCSVLFSKSFFFVFDTSQIPFISFFISSTFQMLRNKIMLL